MQESAVKFGYRSGLGVDDKRVTVPGACRRWLGKNYYTSDGAEMKKLV